MELITQEELVRRQITNTYFKAVNWNKPDDGFTSDIWLQNIAQFWVSREFPVLEDKLVWADLTPAQRAAYSQVLVGLTGLDTKQMNSGMPAVGFVTESDQRKTLISFMGAMEGIHAESYSAIFNTLLTSDEISALHEWGENQPNLNYKVQRINQYYMRGLINKVNGTLTPRDHFLTLAASVLLESYLFYSGFFYPLYLSGKSMMTASGEIIELILRDESLHGLYTGVLAQEVLASMSDSEREATLNEFHELFHDLHRNEIEYTQRVYDPIGLTDEVVKYVEYNADRAHSLLGIEAPFNIDAAQVNPIILNGISTQTKDHDFFSMRGNGYMISVNVQRLEDEHFVVEPPRHFDDITEMELAARRSAS